MKWWRHSSALWPVLIWKKHRITFSTSVTCVWRVWWCDDTPNDYSISISFRAIHSGQFWTISASLWVVPYRLSLSVTLPVRLSLTVSRCLWHSLSGCPLQSLAVCDTPCPVVPYSLSLSVTLTVRLSLTVSHCLWLSLTGCPLQSLAVCDTPCLVIPYSLSLSVTLPVWLSLTVSRCLWHSLSGYPLQSLTVCGSPCPVIPIIIPSHQRRPLPFSCRSLSIAPPAVPPSLAVPRCVWRPLYIWRSPVGPATPPLPASVGGMERPWCHTRWRRPYRLRPRPPPPILPYLLIAWCFIITFTGEYRRSRQLEPCYPRPVPFHARTDCHV